MTWTDDMHWPQCRTNCYSPRIGKSDACEEGHESHECSCEDVAAAHGERMAEAAAEHLSEASHGR